ncbi:MAG: glutamate--tRNA ligase family protein, partial [Trueperaceae bacterium]
MNSRPDSRIPTRDEDRVVARNFVTDAIDADLRAGRTDEVVTRFPPEPNGYLHIGHAKAICLDFGVARDYGGRTFLRFDDTNPTTENPEFVQAIRDDVRWLGFTWTEERFASDYFGRLFELACRLIERGDAYVDSQSEEAIREHRGTVTTPGRPIPDRERPTEESLDLFRRMRDGEFAEGAHVLRAKIDMASPNMLMRDPVLYRIRHAAHYRTGDAWHVYPLYDFAHPLSDAIEGITHSLCTLEFENNREIYDWLVQRLFDPPR